LCGRCPEYAALINDWEDDFHRSITGPVPGTHALVEALDEAGVPLFAITNFSAEFWRPFREREARLFDRFRDVLVSGEVKLLKPDPAIYDLAIARFGIAPGEALFVDDKESNVAAARAAGLRGHHFTTAEDLRRRLEADGLI
jgi:2-haloacid dehalogenase